MSVQWGEPNPLCVCCEQRPAQGFGVLCRLCLRAARDDGTDVRTTCPTCGAELAVPHRRDEAADR